MTKYHEWFKQPIQRWLTIAKYKTMRRIQRSVEMDQVGVVLYSALKNSEP